MPPQSDRPVSAMTLDELFAIGNEQRQVDRDSGMTPEGVDYLTRTWIVDLEHQGLSEAVAKALWHRWML